MSVALYGGCNNCGRYCINQVDYNKKYNVWEEKYFFGLFKNVYHEECLCSNCLPIIKERFSTSTIRRNKIKKLL